MRDIEQTLRSIKSSTPYCRPDPNPGCMIQVQDSDIGFQVIDGEIAGYTWRGVPIPVKPQKQCPNYKKIKLRIDRTGTPHKAPDKLGVQGVDYRVLSQQRAAAIIFQRKVDKMTAHEVLALLAEAREKQEVAP